MKRENEIFLAAVAVSSASSTQDWEELRGTELLTLDSTWA